NWIVRVGGQYLLNDKLTLRAGGYYDSPAVEDDYYSPETPDAVKIGLTAGLSYSPTAKLDVDLSFLYVIGIERDVTYAPADFGGKYKYNAVIPGIGIMYSL
ncbi:MAG TPA: outer membrane protein transport protein, partial [Bacteroidales bacterium]|nr:outer membrane protein transport protein [Bacteroidales bacterium]